MSSSIFDSGILSEENNKSIDYTLQELDKENPLDYILSDNGLQLNKQFKIKYISEYNTENGGIIHSKNKQIYHALLSIIGKYTDNALWPRSYKEIEKEINEFYFQLPIFNKENFKNYIMPLDRLFSDKTCPIYIYTFINNLKIKNKNNYVAYFLYNAVICIILNVANNCTNFYIFYTGLPLINHNNVSKTKIDIKQYIKSVNVNLKLISYTVYNNKLKPYYYQRSALIPCSTKK